MGAHADNADNLSGRKQRNKIGFRHRQGVGKTSGRFSKIKYPSGNTEIFFIEPQRARGM